MKRILLICFTTILLNGCGGCGDCMNCDGSGKAYYQATGEVSCPDCGGDGCSSDWVGEAKKVLKMVQ
jgi:hypothetical protein